MESFDPSQSRRSGDHGDVFPLLVSLQYFKRKAIELLPDPAMFLNLPHKEV